MTLLTLPWPPSVNGYWRSYQGRNILSKAGRAYQQAGAAALAGQQVPQLGTARVQVTLTLYPPDRRRRDVDNYIKAPLDLLTTAGVWDDDSQIDRLTIERGPVVRGGRVDVEVTQI